MKAKIDPEIINLLRKDIKFIEVDPENGDINIFFEDYTFITLIANAKIKVV